MSNGKKVIVGAAFHSRVQVIRSSQQSSLRCRSSKVHYQRHEEEHEENEEQNLRNTGGCTCDAIGRSRF